MIGPNGAPMRLLPWSDPDGSPSFLVGGGSGRVSQMADRTERAQLARADDLIDLATEVLADDGVSAADLRVLGVCLTGSLSEVRRVAESRGARLPDPVDDDHEGAEDMDDADDFGDLGENARRFSEADVPEVTEV